MNSRINLHKSFCELKSPPSFDEAITIRRNDPEDLFLRKVRSKIRKKLREEFGTIHGLLNEKSDALFENRDDRFRAEGAVLREIRVRFLTQGSFAYGTLIRPASSEQEIDLDDGVYLPMPFIDDRPVFSSKALFAVVEETLGDIAHENGWTFERKSTCLRIVLHAYNAHIDLPLFAARESAFRSIEELFEKRTGLALQKAGNLSEELHVSKGSDLRLSSVDILLADRENDWIPSDPRVIQDWFDGHATRFGPVLRRLCRYVKAWRDERWVECDLSSLALMVACVETLQSMEKRPNQNRDDLHVFHTAKSLPELFGGDSLKSPVDGQHLDKDWSDDDRAMFVKAAEELAEIMDAALNQITEKKNAAQHLVDVFGDRFPDSELGIESTASEQITAIIEAPEKKVALPIVGRSISG